MDDSAVQPMTREARLTANERRVQARLALYRQREARLAAQEIRRTRQRQPLLACVEDVPQRVERLEQEQTGRPTRRMEEGA